MNTRLFKSLLLISVAIFAGASPSYGAIKLAANQVLKLGNGAEPKELDPAKTTGVPEHHPLRYRRTHCSNWSSQWLYGANGYAKGGEREKGASLDPHFGFDR